MYCADSVSIIDPVHGYRTELFTLTWLALDGLSIVQYMQLLTLYERSMTHEGFWVLAVVDPAGVLPIGREDGLSISVDTSILGVIVR